MRSTLPVMMLGLSILPLPAAAATVVNCNPTKVKAVVASSERFTTSTVLVNLPEARAAIVQGGSRPSCVIVQFEAQVATNGTLVIGVTIDGDGSGVIPAPRQFVFDTSAYQTTGGTFIIPSVAPGVHRIRVQYAGNGNAVNVKNTNTIIHYAP